MDLYTGPVGSEQIHDLNPGILENGLFWIVEVPPSSVEFNFAGGKARMSREGMGIEDYHDLVNALADGPSKRAEMSFDCRWSDPTSTVPITNTGQHFKGTFKLTSATIEWSARQAGFEFHSEPAVMSAALYAEIGHEQNGSFF